MIGIGRINPFRANCEDAAGLDVIKIFGVCGVRGEAKRCCQCKRGGERPRAVKKNGQKRKWSAS